MSRNSELKYIESEIIIDALPQRIWEVLLDLGSWKDWNPFIIESEGEVAVGERLKNTMLNGEKTYVFKPKVLKVEKHREFLWRGRLIMPGIFDGRHGFRIEAMDNGQCRFVNYEKFSGLCSKMIMRKIHSDTKRNFDRMNQALKEQVESNVQL